MTARCPTIAKQLLALALLAGTNLAVSLPIMGATYRPFSWMSIAPADAATLYPVIQNLALRDGKVALEVTTAPGAWYSVQRSTNIADEASWTETATAISTNPVMTLIDTNPVTRAVYYRVKLILTDGP